MADYDNGVYLDPIGYLTKGILGQYLMHPNVIEPYTDLQNRFPDDTSIGLDSGTPGIQFYYPQKSGATDTVIFDEQYLPMIAKAIGKQTVLMSGGNEPSIYDSGEKDRLITVNLRQATETKIIRLYKFLVNIAQYAKKEFAYEDRSGTTYTVRWWDKTFPYDMHHFVAGIGGYYDIAINLWVVSIAT